MVCYGCSHHPQRESTNFKNLHENVKFYLYSTLVFVEYLEKQNIWQNSLRKPQKDFYRITFYLCLIIFVPVYTGCPKKIRLSFCLISWQPSIRFSKNFLLKTEIHTKNLSTKPFLCDIRWPRNLQNKMQFWNTSIDIHIVSYWPQNCKTCAKLHKQPQDGPW